MAKTVLDWKPKLVGRMLAENIQDLSDAEIERTLKDCVAGDHCIKYAKQLIAEGYLTLADLG